MKITFLVFNIFGIGGTVKTTLNLANFLISQGFEVSIVSLKKTRSKSFFYIHPNIKIVYLYENRSRKLNLIKRVILKILREIPSVLFHKDEEFWKSLNILIDFRVFKFLRTVKTDVLITTLPSLNIISAKYAKSNIIKIGQEHRSIKEYSENMKNNIKNNYRGLDYLICLTEEEQKNYKELKIPNVIIKTIGNPVFHEKPQYKRVMEKKNTIISAGRLIHQKNFQTLIRAFAKVHKNHPEWNLEIYGKGKAREELVNLIHDLNAKKFININDASDNLQNEIAEVKLFVLPSHHESFGMVLVESLAVGTPVIAYASTGPKSIIQHNKNGLLLQDNDVECWEKGISSIIENPILLSLMSENAKSSISKYSIESIGDIWIELLLDAEKEKLKNV